MAKRNELENDTPMIPIDNEQPFREPGPRKSYSNGNPVAIRVYRELLELCDFLLIPASAAEHTKAAPAIFTRLENAANALGEQESEPVENAIRVIEEVVSKSMNIDGTTVDLRTNIIMTREVIERELDREESSTTFTFEDTLKQIEHLCLIIRKNGPHAEGQKHFDDAVAMLRLINAYRKDQDSVVIGDILKLVEALESAPPPSVAIARTGRPASQFKRIWSELMRSGVNVMDPNKAHLAICEYLRNKGEPEDKLPTIQQIESQFKSWTR